MREQRLVFRLLPLSSAATWTGKLQSAQAASKPKLMDEARGVFAAQALQFARRRRL
jgi:hypothetical protein